VGDAVVGFVDDAGVGVVETRLGCCNGDDVARLESPLTIGNFILGDVGAGSGVEALFDGDDFVDEGGIGYEGGVVFGVGRHEADAVGEGYAAELGGDVGYYVLGFVVGDPVGGVVQTRCVAGNFPLTVPGEYDFVVEVLDGVLVLFCYARHAEDVFEVCDAVEAG